MERRARLAHEQAHGVARAGGRCAARARAGRPGAFALARGAAVASFAALSALALSGCALTGWFTETRSAFVPPEPSALVARLAREGVEPSPRVEHYAVLIGGDTAQEHRASLSLAYQVLLEQGYDPAHVYVFDSEGDTPVYPLTDVTTRSALELVFGHLARVVGPEDSLFVLVTGHARRAPARSAPPGEEPPLVSEVVLNGAEAIDEPELARLLEPVPAGVGLVFFDRCLPEALRSPRLRDWVVLHSADTDGAPSGAEFARAFFRAFRDRRLGQPPASVLDAFRFAMMADAQTSAGKNRPRIAHGRLGPERLTLLGTAKSP